MKVLMTGVDKNRLGGMWTVANNYISNDSYNKNVDLIYVSTSTNGSILKRTALMLKAFIKIKFILSKRQVDIVHIHMAEKGSAFRARIITKIAKKNKAKVIIHLHAGPFVDWYSSIGEKKQKKIRELFVLSDIVMVLGKYWQDSLLSIIEKNKIRVLYNGVQIPKKNNYNIDGNYITFMGVLKKEKGIYDLIDAIKKIDNQLDKKYIVKVCGIDLEGNIQKYVNDNGLDKRIYLAGWVDDNEKKKVYKKTVLNVLPSYYEALSMTVIESMANGIPIITTNISTMGELILNTDYLFEPGDVDKMGELILQILKDSKERKKQSSNLYHRANELFSVEMMIKNTLNIYKEVTKQ